jgi:hypothetical protein
LDVDFASLDLLYQRITRNTITLAIFEKTSTSKKKETDLLMLQFPVPEKVSTVMLG